MNKKIASWYEILLQYSFIIELCQFVLTNLNWHWLFENLSLECVLFNELVNYSFENDIFIVEYNHHEIKYLIHVYF